MENLIAAHAYKTSGAKVTIHIGDVRARMAEMPDESVNCVVTSPPYWGLRAYGTAPQTWPDGWVGELGLEPSPGLYIEHMVSIFREVRRVLRKDGTLWLNMGDGWAGGVNGRSAEDTRAAGNDDRTFRDKPFSTVTRAGKSGNKGNAASDFDGPHRFALVDLKPKDLIGMPWMLALALRADGWWLRSDIIWHKSNPMPSSVKDRPTPSHEYLFLLSKSPRYHYDHKAIMELTKSKGKYKKPDGWDTGPGAHGTVHRNGREKGEPNAAPAQEMRQKRDVWIIPTQPFREAHFATFPERLIEPCVLAGTPNGGVVLDPFGGSGTVALVAARLGLSAILIELKPEYAALAYRRICGVISPTSIDTDFAAHGIDAAALASHPIAPRGRKVSSAVRQRKRPSNPDLPRREPLDGRAEGRGPDGQAGARDVASRPTDGPPVTAPGG